MADLPDSDIIGEGYGSKHCWREISFREHEVPFMRVSFYRCKKCKVVFAHAYHIQSNIFKAIEGNGIKEECGKPPLSQGESGYYDVHDHYKKLPYREKQGEAREWIYAGADLDKMERKSYIPLLSRDKNEQSKGNGLPTQATDHANS